jgi:hypothetical protein
MDEMEWDSIGGWLTSDCDIQATIVLFWLVVWSVKFSVLFFFRRFLDSVPTYMDGVSSLPSSLLSSPLPPPFRTYNDNR